MKKIIILALLISPLAYGKARVPRPELPVVSVKNRQLVVEGKVRKMTLPFIPNVSEEVQVEMAQAAEAVEGCEEACFTNMIQIASQETPFDSPEYRALQAIRYSTEYVESQDAATVRDTIKYAKNIVGEEAEELQGATVHASFISRDWNDPAAQGKIPVLTRSWAKASRISEDSIAPATKIVFGLDSVEEGEQRKEEIKGNCQAPHVG